MRGVDGFPLLDRSFELVVFDWDGTAVADRGADATEVRHRIEALSAAGVHAAVVTGTHVGNVDGQLQARPTGPGELHLCVNRGSEVFTVGRDGPELVWRRDATAAEIEALDRAADLTVSRLEERGVRAKVVSQRLNRRKIDIIPEPAWEDPPKAVIDRLLTAVTERLTSHGITTGLAGAVAIGLAAAQDAGLTDARVTSDAKHVEIGLTDKGDSVRWLARWAASLGIGSGLVLVAGDEFGPLGSVLGSDSVMLVPELARAVAVSVGVEPNGVPPDVLHVPGGPPAFVALLDEQLQRRQDLRAPSIDEDPAWVIEVVDAPARRRVHESLLALSNGTVGVRSGREEDGAGSEPLVLVSSIYTSGDKPRLLPAPVWPSLVIRGETTAPDRWLLDLRTGVVTRQREGSGRPLRTVRFVSLADPTAMAMRSEGPASRLAAGPALVEPTERGIFDRHEDDDGVETAVTSSPNGGGGIAIACATKETSSGGLRHIERLAAVDADPHGSPGVVVAQPRVADLEQRGFDHLLADHRAAWARRWADAEIRILGDQELGVAIRFGLFHLLACAPSAGEAAVGARGLTGPAYSGHVFWDSDVFILPTLAAIHPRAARAMLEYRIRRLPAARRAAAAHGSPGARFPWESASDGTDVTPSFVRDAEGRIIPIRTGQHELHIQADVAWAACEYAAWTGDERFLATDARDLVLETARWWAAKIRVDGEGRAHIYGVTGPDEYHEVVDDNAFTNVMARWHLRTAAALCDTAGGATLAEAARWRRLAGAIVDGYSADTGVYEQFAGYYGLEPRLITDLATPPVAADLVLGADFVHRSQITKQADVLMLHHLVPGEVAPGSLGPNVDFYGPRCAHGSSLSPPIQVAALARAGRVDEALALFRIACRLDLDDLTQTTAGGLHLATMGGVWQALVYGFCGVRPAADALLIDPHLPAVWEGVEISVRYNGGRVRVRATHDEVTLEAERPLAVRVGAERTLHTLPAGTSTLTPGRRP